MLRQYVTELWLGYDCCSSLVFLRPIRHFTPKLSALRDDQQQATHYTDVFVHMESFEEVITSVLCSNDHAEHARHLLLQLLIKYELRAYHFAASVSSLSSTLLAMLSLRLCVGFQKACHFARLANGHGHSLFAESVGPYWFREFL